MDIKRSMPNMIAVSECWKKQHMLRVRKSRIFPLPQRLGRRRFCWKQQFCALKSHYRIHVRLSNIESEAIVDDLLHLLICDLHAQPSCFVSRFPRLPWSRKHAYILGMKWKLEQKPLSQVLVFLWYASFIPRRVASLEKLFCKDMMEPSCHLGRLRRVFHLLNWR